MSLDKKNTGSLPNSEAAAEKKSGFFRHFRRLFRFKISFRDLPLKDDGDRVSRNDPVESAPKAEKQPEEREQKKAPVKSKKKKIILIAAVGGLAVGAAVFAFFSPVKEPPTAEERLAEAASLMAEQKYEQAAKIYEELIAADETFTEAYLGLADTFIMREDADTALQILNGALAVTANDSRIQEKIHELIAPPEPENTQEAPPEVEFSDEPIEWKDAALEKMVRMALGKNSSEPVSEKDLADVKRLRIFGETHASIDNSLKTYNRMSGYEIDGVIYTQRGSIRSLDDLVHFKNLRRLAVGYNSVEDISGLKELNLQIVELYFNNISDISPLSGHTRLRFLHLFGNRITDISPVENLTSLQELFIGNNQVSDISPVKGLSNLTYLYAENNKITDISFINDMPNLKHVSFVGNPLSEHSLDAASAINAK